MVFHFLLASLCLNKPTLGPVFIKSIIKFWALEAVAKMEYAFGVQNCCRQSWSACSLSQLPVPKMPLAQKTFGAWFWLLLSLKSHPSPPPLHLLQNALGFRCRWHADYWVNRTSSWLRWLWRAKEGRKRRRRILFSAIVLQRWKIATLPDPKSCSWVVLACVFLEKE